MKSFFLLVSLVFSLHQAGFSKSRLMAEGDSVEVILIEAYTPQDKPQNLVLAFFASEPVKAEVVFSNKTVPLGTDFQENFTAIIDITDVPRNEGKIFFRVRVLSESGQQNYSELYDIPSEGNTSISGGADITGCLIGAAVYFIPAIYGNFPMDTLGIGYGKEFPLLTFFRGGYNYPNGYLAFEYNYSTIGTQKSRYNFGYKQIIETPIIQYVSLGFSYSTDFKGRNAVLPELSLGLFRMLHVFTVYTRVGYYVYPSDRNLNMLQVSLGLFSSFFSLQK